jgi:hypothetical protein
LTILGGTGKTIAPGIVTDPQFAQEHALKDKRAEPVGEWS